MADVLTVVDFEGSRLTGVFETGMVRIEGTKIASIFTALHSPRRALSMAERVLCGVDDWQLADHEPFSEMYERFVAARQSGLLAAHNATTEHHLLLDAFPFPPAGPAPEGGVLSGWGPWVDTLVLARRFIPGLEEYGLGAVIDALGLTDVWKGLAADCCPPARCRPHAALYDALGSALLILDFVQRGWLKSLGAALAGGDERRNQATQGELF